MALLVALFLQFATFPAPLMAFKGMLPNIVHSVPLLALRLGAIAGGAVVGVWLAGVAVQLPWLLLPGFFLALTVIMYLVPIRQNPIAGYCVALMLVVVTYSGIFSPLTIGGNALTLAVGFCRRHRHRRAVQLPARDPAAARAPRRGAGAAPDGAAGGARRGRRPLSRRRPARRRARAAAAVRARRRNCSCWRWCACNTSTSSSSAPSSP